MRLRTVPLDVTVEPGEVAVVIDVLRAFTTAAHALAAGAEEIVAVATVEEAFAWRAREPQTLLLGEVDSVKVEGFDLGNSPTDLEALDLRGRRIVQRTTAGTQGLVRNRHASRLFAASLCCAGATVAALRELDPPAVALIVTGSHTEDHGDEDRACADLLSARLLGRPCDDARTRQRVIASRAAEKFLDPARPAFRASDVTAAAEIDRFDFALGVSERDGALVIRPFAAGRSSRWR